MKLAVFTTIVLAAALLAGCAGTRGHKGVVLDPQLAAGIQPGVDNRDSVEKLLGRPSFTGQFTPNDWYYVSRDTKNMAYNMPHPDKQTILHVRFDQNGNVASVDHRGLEQVASIHPSSDQTPTLGSHHSLFDELFGNIGAVGATGKGAPTRDNPNP